MFNLTDPHPDAASLIAVSPGDYAHWLATAATDVRQWLAATGFVPKADAVTFLPPQAGGGPAVLGIMSDLPSPVWALAGLAAVLPPRRYTLATALPDADATAAALGWALAAYSFDRYRPPGQAAAELVWPTNADRNEVVRVADAIFLARDLINTPAEDMGPAELSAAALALGRDMDAEVRVVVGDDLLAENYPLIHAVGRASSRSPRLIDLRWGAEDAPRLTLVGKGVCFDSGGLNLKSREGMRTMNRDMGGAAVLLGLGRALMAARLPVRLRILIPAVDNAVSGGAMRPLDIFRSRSGKTVEIGDTDAEGRLILCDALAEAERERPDLLIDCATLTGAARVALGGEVQAMFCDDERIAAELQALSHVIDDPLWRLPIWRPYRKLLESRVAELNNLAETPHGGAITAAVFLADFVSPTTPWIHLDINAANERARPGRPAGGEATGLRALYALLRTRYP